MIVNFHYTTETKQNKIITEETGMRKNILKVMALMLSVLLMLSALVGCSEQGPAGPQGEKGAAGAQGEKGDKGDTGAAGVSIVSAYVDEDLHLWLVLSDGTKIDAGYVGITPPPTIYTVTFVDYDGKELKKENVESGSGATAPAAPAREGYNFIGWDKSFDNVTSSMTVTAQYESSAPQITVSRAAAKAGDENITITITLKNNPGILGASFKLTYDNGLTLTGVAKGEALSSLTFTKPGKLTSSCNFGWDGLDTEDTSDGVVLTLTFKVDPAADAGTYNISVSYGNGDIFDDGFNGIAFILRRARSLSGDLNRGASV